jgi:hypothetical protein
MNAFQSSQSQNASAKHSLKRQGPSIAHADMVYKLTIFVVAALLIKAKPQHEKNQNKNTGLFINCIANLRYQFPTSNTRDSKMHS